VLVLACSDCTALISQFELAVIYAFTHMRKKKPTPANASAPTQHPHSRWPYIQRGPHETNIRRPSGGFPNNYTPKWIDLRVQITRIFTWAGAGRRIIFLFLKLGHLPSCCACHGDRNRDLHSQFNHNRILGGVTHATYTLACISVGSAVTQACVLYGDSVNMHVSCMIQGLNT
jgi:hypothetical protein